MKTRTNVIRRGIAIVMLLLMACGKLDAPSGRRTEDYGKALSKTAENNGSAWMALVQEDYDETGNLIETVEVAMDGREIAMTKKVSHDTYLYEDVCGRTERHIHDLVLYVKGKDNYSDTVRIFNAPFGGYDARVGFVVTVPLVFEITIDPSFGGEQ